MALPTDKMRLTITHIPTGLKVHFSAYLELLSDMYSSNWNAEDVYGRMDPIATFTSTQRAISLAWNVPAESFEHAKENLKNLNKLMSFLYPLYQDSGVGGATAINQSPLIRIKFGNLVQNAVTGDGLLGFANGFTFDPALEFGMFHSLKGTPEYYPKTFRLNTELKVLHEHSLGFGIAGGDGKSFSFRGDLSKRDFSGFPYGSSPVTRLPSQINIPNNNQGTDREPAVNPNSVAVNGVGPQPLNPSLRPLPGTPAASLSQGEATIQPASVELKPSPAPLPKEEPRTRQLPKAPTTRRSTTPSAGRSILIPRQGDDIF